MVIAKSFAAAAVLSVMAVLTACATTHSGLRSSADRLERNATALARDARGYDSNARYAEDARQLADEAHDFRRTVDDSRADRRDVQGAFEQLSRRYHDLRDEVDRSGSRQAQVDFRPVTEAYLDVERAIGGYPDRDHDRYARDRDRYERR